MVYKAAARTRAKEFVTIIKLVCVGVRRSLQKARNGSLFFGRRPRKKLELFDLNPRVQNQLGIDGEGHVQLAVRSR